MNENRRKLGESLGKVAGGTVRAVGESYRFVKLLIIGAIVALVVFGLWLVRDMGISVVRFVKTGGGLFASSEPPKPAGERDPVLQLQCLTAIVAKDIEGEDGQKLGTARQEVAYAAMRYRLAHPGVTTCDIMAKALTLVPVGYKHPLYWQDRTVGWIKAGQSAAAWTTAELVAESTYGKTPPSTTCATHYVRAEINLKTFGFSWETNAAKQIDALMKKDPALQNAGLKMKFYCP